MHRRIERLGLTCSGPLEAARVETFCATIERTMPEVIRAYQSVLDRGDPDDELTRALLVEYLVQRAFDNVADECARPTDNRELLRCAVGRVIEQGLDEAFGAAPSVGPI